MDNMIQMKITNVINEINNQLDKDYIDESVARTLMQLAVNRISLLMTHIGFIETQLQNVQAEVQRLSQIAKY
jgi:aryl-alcohol dehydrogenase-like predicted oxidoreductase